MIRAKDYSATRIEDVCAEAALAKGECHLIKAYRSNRGAFILAKANGGAAIAVESVVHWRRYIEMLFAKPQEN